MIHTIYILSKSGGLIYQQQFQERSEHADSISLNDHIVLAGMFHGFHAMSHEIDGTNTGVEKIYFGSCVLDCFLTPTGLKLFTVADRSSSDQLPKLLSSVYELLTDVVLKNPFLSLLQPIKCEPFRAALVKLAANVR